MAMEIRTSTSAMESLGSIVSDLIMGEESDERILLGEVGRLSGSDASVIMADRL